jgi:hypothetical protein
MEKFSKKFRSVSISIHLLIFVACAGLVTSVRAILSPRYQNELAEIERKAREERTLDYVKTWSSFRFADLRRPEVVPYFLNEAASRAQIPPEEVPSFRESIEAVIKYLISPDFYSYYSIKTKHRDFSFSPTIQSGLTKTVVTSGKESIKDPLRTFWLSSMDTNSLTHCALSTIRVASTTTNSLADLITGQASLGFTYIAFPVNPGFKYYDHMTNSSERFINIGFLAKTRTSTNLGPVYLTLLWEESRKRWVFESIRYEGILGLRNLL